MSVDELFQQLRCGDENVRIAALRQLCADFKSNAAPFFLSDMMSDPSAKVRETCAELLGGNPALASLSETPLWLTGYAADSVPSVRTAALRSLGKVDPDLRFPPARGLVLLATLLEKDPATQATARNVLHSALQRDVASQDSDRQRDARVLLHGLEEPRLVRFSEVLVVVYDRASSAAVAIATYEVLGISKPPLIPKFVPWPQPEHSRLRRFQRLSPEDVERAYQGIDEGDVLSEINEIQETGGLELSGFLQELEDIVNSQP